MTKRLRNESGQAVLMTVLFLAVLIGAAALTHRRRRVVSPAAPGAGDRRRRRARRCAGAAGERHDAGANACRAVRRFERRRRRRRQLQHRLRERTTPSPSACRNRRRASSRASSRSTTLRSPPPHPRAPAFRTRSRAWHRSSSTRITRSSPARDVRASTWTRRSASARTAPAFLRGVRHGRSQRRQQRHAGTRRLDRERLQRLSPSRAVPVRPRGEVQRRPGAVGALGSTRHRSAVPGLRRHGRRWRERATTTSSAGSGSTSRGFAGHGIERGARAATSRSVIWNGLQGTTDQNLPDFGVYSVALVN